MNGTQPALFNDPGSISYVCQCYKQSDGTWYATLYNWYTATGATMAEAAQKCVDNYERENRYATN